MLASKLLRLFLRSFSSYNSKTNAVPKILISDLKSALTNTSIKIKNNLFWDMCIK